MSAAAEAMETLDSRLWDVYGAGVNPWAAGAKLIGGRMGLETQLALDGVVELQAGFARIMQAQDARRFRVASDAERASAMPAMILFCGDLNYGEGEDHDDLLALSLRPDSRRFWRMTCGCDWLGMLRPDQDGTLRLRQDAHLYVSGLIKAAAYQRRGREEGVTALEKGLLLARQRSGVGSFAEAIKRPGDDPARLAYVRGFADARRAQAAAVERWRLAGLMPAGALILDPMALDWTRRGAIGDAEWIEIVDAPADGPLGRALVRMNPRIGTKHGVRLVGQEPKPKYQRRAA